MNNREPYLLIADDDPRIIDFYRQALGLPPTVEEQEADQELDEMFSLLEGDDPFEEPAPSHCSAVTVTQGLEALRLFEERAAAGSPFDLALLDMRMPPGIDGLETALGLREQAPDLPIIFFTAYSDHKDEHLEEQVGGNFCLLRKPIEEAVLRDQIRKMLPQGLCFEMPERSG